MVNLSGSNFSNVTKMTTEGDSQNVPQEVSFIITIIINSISCPFTVLFNVLVKMAVKRRPRLQTNTNILLACLAATDVLAGFVVQPSFIAWKSLYLLNAIDNRVAKVYSNSIFRFLSICSSLQLMLVTCERLIAIKLTVYYPHLVTKRNIKLAEIFVWSFSSISELFRQVFHNSVTKVVQNVLVSLTLTFCIVFIASVYVILYRETRRHEKKIKNQQLLQEEVERFAKESKALKTTVFVVSAVMLSFLPLAITLLLAAKGLKKQSEYKAMFSVLSPLVRSCAMLNSLLNPLIYCLRQREMRKFVLRVPCQAVEPAMN